MDFAVLERRLGVKFNDRSHLKQALTHRSYLNENQGWPLDHNERLEFLGDAVLELIVTDFLFRKYPREPEGVLTEYRSILVNTLALATLAVELGFNEFLLLARGEAKNRGQAREYILGCAVEAVIGAMYVDRGYEYAQQFVAKYILPKLEGGVATCWRDPKSRLQEAAQKYLKITPAYRVLEQTGPDHKKQFVVGVYFGSDLITTGRGGAKQRAEVEAAKAALSLKNWN